MESACEDQAVGEETSSLGAESTSIQNTATTTTTNSSNNSSNNNNNDKHKSHPMPVLPIDPESLENAQVTILKPGTEEPISPQKSTKKNKKKKTKKAVNQPNLLADPLETEFCVQNEYLARLRVLRQQIDALDAGDNLDTTRPITSGIGPQNPVMLLDPDNPFYLPQHLKDNPEELENVLQKKLSTTSPPGLQQETINTLLDFMYDWLKAEGPMRTSDPRLAEQVAENFPQEARDYVNQCGGITGLLMQSIKFAMIDGIICVYDDVMKAQEMICQEVTDKMNRSKYLVRYSDGQKAKRYTHLLDDAKSTCSTTSSSSQMAGSVAESCISRDSVANNRYHSSNGHIDDHNNNNDIDNDSIASLAPLSKTIVDQYNKFDVSHPTLNPTAPAFEPLILDNEEKDEDEEEEEPDRQWSTGDSSYIENWAAQAGEEIPLKPDEEEEEQDEEEEHEQEDEDEEDEEEEEEVVQEEGEEERTESLQDEEDTEATEQYISQLQEEIRDKTKEIEKVQEQNQELSDRLYQVKSQYKSEVMTLKQQLEELKDQNKSLTAEKNAIALQREADLKKFKADQSRANEEMKTNQSRAQSLELKCERTLDSNNELQAKLAEEMELTTQLKDELEKMKNLEESLTSCSRRAREAEVKYLGTKKDLVDADMTRTIKRLSEEATAMKLLLPGVTEDSVLDRNTLTRTIVAWDEAIKNLLDQQRVFKDESTRLMGMIHQGRPLSALPAGDLGIPALPYLTVAPLLSLFQNNHQKPPPPVQPTLAVPEPVAKEVPRHPSPAPQPTSQPPKSTPPPPLTEPPPQVPLMSVPVPLMQVGAFTGHPMFMHNGGPPPPPPILVNPYASGGAIPKTTAPPPPTHPPPPNMQPTKTSEIPNMEAKTDSPNQLFVGQLPWEYSDADVKKLLPSNTTVGAIGAPPPKLVRPQTKTVPSTSKLGGQTTTVKEESAMPSSSSYARLIEVCKQRFGKEFNSPEICHALREVRIQNNNSLSGLTTEKIVDRVRQQLRSRRPSAGAATVAPWAGITQGSGAKTGPEWKGPSKGEVVKEETCSICLEPLNTSPKQSLACLHIFHEHCIKDWIKIQSSCPNCRKFALMPNEYPTLTHS